MTDLVKQLVGALDDLIGIADVAMRSANRDGAEYDRDAELAEARAALTAAKAGGWQSMETMPKEGKFLVYMPTQRVNQIQAARRHNGLLIIGNAFAFDVSDKPTAWQPLPNPPKEQSAGGPGSVDAVANPLSPT